MIFRSLLPIIDFETLHKEVFDIINRIGFKDNQIILQSIYGDEEWHLGTGVIEELEEKDEKKYSIINSSIRDTGLSKIIEKYQGFRARIMKMYPRNCYSVHKDPTPRIHIPIKTNDQCWMVWPYDNFCAAMPAGKEYFTDTTKMHTFINAGLEPRIHVIFNVDRIPKISFI